MKKITFLIAFLLFILKGYTQVEIYKSVNDYKNNTPEKYSGEAKYYADYRDGKTTMLEIKDGKKVKVQLVDVWGFKYNGILFRRDPKNGNAFTGLLSQGRICYWENAVYIFEKLYKVHQGYTNDRYGPSVYLSTTPDSELISGDFRAFIHSNKEYLQIADCAESNGLPKINKFLNGHYKLGGEDNIAALNYYCLFVTDKIIDPVRKCIKEFNGNFNSQYLK